MLEVCVVVLPERNARDADGSTSLDQDPGNAAETRAKWSFQAEIREAALHTFFFARVFSGMVMVVKFDRT